MTQVTGTIELTFIKKTQPTTQLSIVNRHILMDQNSFLTLVSA